MIMEEKLNLYEEMINRLYKSEEWLANSEYDSWDEVKLKEDRNFQLRWNIEYRLKKMQEELHEMFDINKEWNKWV